MSAWSELAACGYTIRAAVIVDDKARATATRELAHALLDGMLDAYVEVGHYHRATP